MSDAASRTLRLSYDGDSWLAMDADGNYITLASDSAWTLPELPDGSQAASLLLPAESVLSRAFSLPLPNTRLIDQDVLAQELEEHTAEDAQDWWLAWQAGRDENGVSGMMFGLPQALRQQIDEHESWRQIQTLGVDAWARLSAKLAGHDAGESVAVFDVDASGVFFGLWQAGADGDGTGYWRGMRRLNWPEGDLSDVQWASMADNIRRSLHAMGWPGEEETPDPEAGSGALGRLLPGLHAALNLPLWQGALVGPAELLSRHNANLAVPPASGLNFRHGRWRSQSGFGQLKPWYRSLAMAAALVALWAAGMMWQNHRLETQLASAQQRIIDSFHKGLPNENVLIDALAQLRKAAGGAGGGKQQSSAVLWLQQIGGLQRVYQQMPWQMKTLSLVHKKITMSGQVKDLQAMNRIRQALQKEMGVDVKVQDTELGDNQVTFRMIW